MIGNVIIFEFQTKPGRSDVPERHRWALQSADSWLCSDKTTVARTVTQFRLTPGRFAVISNADSTTASFLQSDLMTVTECPEQVTFAAATRCGVFADSARRTARRAMGTTCLGSYTAQHVQCLRAARRHEGESQENELRGNNKHARPRCYRLDDPGVGVGGAGGHPNVSDAVTVS